jgi:hypothetical protein
MFLVISDKLLKGLGLYETSIPIGQILPLVESCLNRVSSPKRKSPRLSIQAHKQKIP